MDAMLKRFEDPSLRARIVREIEDAMAARFGGAAGVYLPATKRQLVDVIREWKVSPGEAVVRILEQGNATAILTFGSESATEHVLLSLCLGADAAAWLALLRRAGRCAEQIGIAATASVDRRPTQIVSLHCFGYHTR